MSKLDALYKGLFLTVVVFGGYHYYEILVDANQALKSSLNQANTNIALVLGNTNRAISDIYEKLDIIQSKSLDVISKADENRDFGNEILNLIESTECQVGKKPLVFRWKLKKPKSCIDWAADARKEVRFVAFSSYNEEEMISYIATTMLGGNWLIKVKDGEITPLREWIKLNYKKGLTSQDKWDAP